MAKRTTYTVRTYFSYKTLPEIEGYNESLLVPRSRVKEARQAHIDWINAKGHTSTRVEIIPNTPNIKEDD